MKTIYLVIIGVLVAATLLPGVASGQALTEERPKQYQEIDEPCPVYLNCGLSDDPDPSG